MKTVTFAIPDLICSDNQQTLEQKVKLNPHIEDASIDFVAKTATITYHDGMIIGEKIKKLISDCGFQCQPLPFLSGKEALKIAEHKMKQRMK